MNSGASGGDEAPVAGGGSRNVRSAEGASSGPDDKTGTNAKEEEDDEDFNGDDNSEDLAIVRQDSSFSKLSADSWLKVESEYDHDEDTVDNEAGDAGNERRSLRGDERFWNDIALHLKSKPPSERSVLECIVQLLAGSGASKKRLIGVGEEKHLWLAATLQSIHWISKRKYVDGDKISLQQVTLIRASSAKRSVLIESTDRKRIALAFPTTQDLYLWTRCLAYLSPSQTKVLCPDVGIDVSMRKKYNMLTDEWGGLPLSQHIQINDYYVFDGAATDTTSARLVLSRKAKTFYAMRFVTRSSLGSIRDEELAVLKKLNHPNVLRFREFIKFKSDAEFHAVFDFVPGALTPGDYDGNKAQQFPEDAAKRLTGDVAAALLYLHSCKIVLGDLRPETLLVGCDSMLKVNPLGATVLMFSPPWQRRLGGSPKDFYFAAPERCVDVKDAPAPTKDAYELDVWSLGVLLYFLLYGRVPFAGKSALSVQEGIVGRKLSFPADTARGSKKVRELLSKLLNGKDPRERMKLEEFIRHGAFDGTSMSLPFTSALRATQGRPASSAAVTPSARDVELAVTEGKYFDPTRAADRK